MDAIERRAQAGAEAADWWVRLQTDDLPRGEREQFIDWLRESSIHVAEMLRVAQVHGALEHFKRWTRIATDIPAAEQTTGQTIIPLRSSLPTPLRPSGRRGRAGWVPASIAAALALLLVSAPLLLPTLRGQTIDTERAERREVVLSDGSVLQVDPQTRLRVQFDDRTRRILLERGRALFRVAKNPNRPFVVQADSAIVRAVGTAFGVERQRQGVVVTVAEGKVAVSSSLLTAGQQVTVRHDDTSSPVRTVDSRRELAWAEGRLIFENDTVSTVVGQFNRYNRMQLHVADPALAARPISGVFSASDPESFVAFVQSVAPVSIVRREGEDITLLPARP